MAARLKRQIAYYCGVITRTESRERIQHADAAIREREREICEAMKALQSLLVAERVEDSDG